MKFHEKKLLKHDNFYEWKHEHNIKEVQVARRYGLNDREDYSRYNKLCGVITKIVSLLKTLSPKDSFRIQLTKQLIDKLYEIGLIPNKENLQACEKIPVAAFCRRRLPAVLVRLKFCQNLKEANNFITHGRSPLLFFLTFKG